MSPIEPNQTDASDGPLPFCRIGPASSDRWGSASLMYTTEPLRPPTFRDLMEDVAKLLKTTRSSPWLPPALNRIDLSTGARDAILRSPYITRTARDPARDPFDWSSATLMGVPVTVDPNLPDRYVVFRDREGNVLHVTLLSE